MEKIMNLLKNIDHPFVMKPVDYFLKDYVFFYSIYELSIHGDLKNYMDNLFKVE